MTIRAQEIASREGGSALSLLGCRVQYKLMLLKSLSILAVAITGLAPLQAKAASGCSLASHYGLVTDITGRQLPMAKDTMHMAIQ